MKRIALLVSGIAGLAVLSAPSAGAESLKALADKLVPHRAIYELKTANISEATGIAEVTGAISYEFRESCTAWDIKHRFKLAVTRADKPEAVTLSEFESKEAKDGTRFAFDSVTKTNGQVSEEVKGHATLERPGGPGEVVLTAPESKRAKLPAGTVFPTYHSLVLVAAAQEGRRTVWAPLYDASDKADYSGVNAIILSPARQSMDRKLPEGGPALVNDRGWSFRISYFPSDKPDEKPTYELTLRLNENGVTPWMLLDYGQFILRAELRTIEPLPQPKNC